MSNVQEKKTRTQELLKLRQEQREMKCYQLCVALKELKPIRLQCCKHPMADFASYIKLFKNCENAELVECEFNQKKGRYSFYVNIDKIIVDYPYVCQNGDSGRKEFQCTFKEMPKLINFIKVNNDKIVEISKIHRVSTSWED